MKRRGKERERKGVKLDEGFSGKLEMWTIDGSHGAAERG